VPAGAEGGSSSSAVVRTAQQGSRRLFQRPLGCGQGAARAGAPRAAVLMGCTAGLDVPAEPSALGSCSGGGGRPRFSGCPLCHETGTGSARRSRNSSCWEPPGCGLNPPNAKPARAALKPAAAQREQPSSFPRFPATCACHGFATKPKQFWTLWKVLPLLPASRWKLPSSLGWWNRDGTMDLSHREPGTARAWHEAQGRGAGAGQSQRQGFISFLCQIAYEPCRGLSGTRAARPCVGTEWGCPSAWPGRPAEPALPCTTVTSENPQRLVHRPRRSPGAGVSSCPPAPPRVLCSAGCAPAGTSQPGPAPAPASPAPRR